MKLVTPAWARNDRTVRNLLLGSFGIFAIVVVIMALYVINLGSSNRDLINKYKAQQDADQRQQVANHVARLADQARVDNEIRDLACILVSRTPNDPKNPLIGEFRLKYRCPPYSPLPTKIAVTGPTTHTTITATDTVSSRPIPTTVSVPAPSPTRTSVTRSTPAPRPTVCLGSVCITLLSRR